MLSKAKVHFGSRLLFRGNFGLASRENLEKPIALIILNQPLLEFGDFFTKLWDLAAVKICVDGGSNALYNFGVANNSLQRYIPDLIVGDLDSLLNQTRMYYESQGVFLKKISEQDSTDFEKALRTLDRLNKSDIAGSLNKDCEKMPMDYYNIFVLGGTTGRLDHTLHCLKVLQNTCNDRNMVLISPVNMTFALPMGENKIHVQKGIDGAACGILPIAGECTVTTSGLRWDMADGLTSLIGFLSSSNIIDEDIISVNASKDVIWTCEFNPKIIGDLM